MQRKKNIADTKTEKRKVKEITDKLEEGIEYGLVDHRERGRPIRVSFNGNLKTQQQLAARHLLAFDYGILSAATAFGKTVVCSYLISERKVNTLRLKSCRR